MYRLLLVLLVFCTCVIHIHQPVETRVVERVVWEYTLPIYEQPIDPGFLIYPKKLPVELPNDVIILELNDISECESLRIYD